ncbi:MULTISPECIES: hypothetical protein [Natrialbaceae]|uniref:hypothetical protein n=1 Tax=Natrialbaceae TaxID=1644061 RepID=UPI00207D6BFF|nr:hypothetical protein [Natronococcus sp. CG52]
MEEEAVSTGSRESDSESNDSILRIRLFRVDVEIPEVSVPKRDEVTECTEVGVEASATIVSAHFELDTNSLASGDLLRSEFDSVPLDHSLARGLRTVFVLGRTR